jgi:hypothetical protein
MIKKRVTAALVVGALSGQALATTLSTDLTGDNSFALFISTDDSLPGTSVGAGTDWTVTYSFNAALTPGVTDYIHVAATNDSGPAAFIGDFTLSDANFQFANGSQFLVTDTTHWQVSPSGFGSGYGTLLASGPTAPGRGARARPSTRAPSSSGIPALHASSAMYIFQVPSLRWPRFQSQRPTP